MKQMILAKCGEIVLKGLNRSHFDQILLKNIKASLKGLGAFDIRLAQSTIYIQTLENADMDEAYERVKRVFGLAAVCKAYMCEKTMESILALAKECLTDVLEEANTFKVEAKRSDKRFPLKSPEICNEVGGVLLEQFPHLRVDVHHPEVTVTVEVRDFGAYIHAVREPGAGGMPYCSNGSAALLLSGGIDSPVAGYMMAKRGISVSAIHFVSPPYTSDRALLKVEQLCQKITDYCGDINFYCVPFTEIQEELKRRCPEEYFTIIMRRLMMEIAQRICEKEECLALITGESVGQVASQTLHAMVCTDAACRIPVFRPLIGMDKTEIIEIARKIDTFDISILPYEDCCTVFTPKHPKIRPQLSEIEEAQNAAGFEELIEQAVSETVLKRFRLEV